MDFVTTRINRIYSLDCLWCTCSLKYRKDGHWSKMDLRLKGGVTVAILLTGLVYHFMLAPQKTAEEFWTIENFLSHYIVPFGTFADCIVFDKGHCYKWYDPFTWTLLPLSLCDCICGDCTHQPVFRLEITKMAHSHISS